MSYFDMDDQEKRYMQQLIMHSYIAEGIDTHLPSDDVKMLMVDELYHLEYEERYEDAALYRDVIKLYEEHIADRKRLYNK